MKHLDAYIARQFALTVVFSLLSFVALFVVLDLIDNLNDFFDNGIDFGLAVQYYLSSVPEVVLLTSPVAVLLSCLYITGRLTVSNELTAMFSAGISLQRIIFPFGAVAFALTLFNIVNSGWLLPKAMVYKHKFATTYFGKTFESLFPKGSVHILESADRILTIGRLDASTGSAERVTLETFDGSGMTMRIDAERMSFDETSDLWIFENSRKRFFLPDTTLYVHNPGTDTLKLSVTATTLQEYRLLPEEMNIVQQYRFIEQKKHAGFSNLHLAIIELHSRIALPLASLVIVLVGVPLSTRKKRSGLALEAGLSLFIGFLYLGMQKTVVSIGESGLIDPVLTAWLPNIVFICIGIGLYHSSKT